MPPEIITLNESWHHSLCKRCNPSADSRPTSHCSWLSHLVEVEEGELLLPCEWKVAFIRGLPKKLVMTIGQEVEGQTWPDWLSGVPVVPCITAASPGVPRSLPPSILAMLPSLD